MVWRIVRRSAQALILAGLFTALAPLQPARAETTIRLAISTLPPSLGNPHKSTNVPTIYTWAALFDCLTFLDAQGNLVPWLATSWTAEEPTRWRFQLRDGVKFSNGESFDAEAVAATISYLISPLAKGDSVAREMIAIASVRVVDRLTVDILTKEPAPSLPRDLATVRIVAPGQWARLGPDGFAKEPVGTGPFMLDRWTPSRAYFSAFKGSWRAPSADRLELIVLPETAGRLQGLLAGQLDVALGLGPDDAKEVERRGHKSLFVRNPGVNVLSFITTLPGPFKDPRVRLALNLGTNREAIVASLLAGATVVPSQTAPRMSFGYDPALMPYPYDPERAKALLAEAGFPNGFAFVLQAVANSATDNAIFQQIAADLARIGVKMEIRPMTSAELVKRIGDGKWQGQTFYMNFGVAPSLEAIRPLRLHSCDTIKPWFCEPSVMPLLQAARREQDPAQRLALARQVMAAYRDLVPAILLYEAVDFIGLAARVEHFEMTNQFLLYDRIKIKAK